MNVLSFFWARRNVTCFKEKRIPQMTFSPCMKNSHRFNVYRIRYRTKKHIHNWGDKEHSMSSWDGNNIFDPHTSAANEAQILDLNTLGWWAYILCFSHPLKTSNIHTVNVLWPHNQAHGDVFWQEKKLKRPKWLKAERYIWRIIKAGSDTTECIIEVDVL